MSQSLANNHLATNGDHHESPSWSKLQCALRLLFSRFGADLDLSNVGKAQRLQFEEFQLIFYYLFLIIDPSDTKKKFRNLCQARNQEEKARFLQLAVQFINDRNMVPQKITISHIRTLGGEPFRRLLAAIIKQAIERECHNFMTRNNYDLDDLSSQMELMDSKRDHVDHLARQLVDSLEKLREMMKLEAESRLSIQVRKNQLATKSGGGVSPDFSSRVFCELLLSRLEQANARAKVASETISKIQLPAEEIDGDSSANNLSSNSNRRKRLSHFIREAKEQLNQADNSSSTGQERLEQQLIQYDCAMDSLLVHLEGLVQRYDERFLRDPKNQELYEYYEKLIPEIDIKPLGHQDYTEGPKPSMSQLENILTQYSVGSKSELSETLDILRGLFT